VSKFFRALEHAERERTQDRAIAVEPDGEPVMPTAPSHGDVAPPAASVAAPPRVSEPARPMERAPAYGAPITRHVDAAHGEAFSVLLEPPPGVEPGQIDDHLVSVLEPTSVAAEQYRSVRLAIENFRRERGTRLVAVSSPGRGDGKTMTAINLAGALAQAPDARVALVEADLRHPSMAEALGLGGGHGLSRYLLDHSLHVDGALERPRGLGFAVLAAGSASSMP
jgi:hypothetical protein